MAATQVQRPQGHYFKVLENHKKRLGNYEQMHFRKSIVLPREEISLAPRRTSRPQLVPFDKNTAATYLRQTENQWLLPNLTRQGAAKLLFNKPTGTFVVRNSQKERHYALSLRMPVDDPAVSHFLIQTNQQNFLTIQGSNLPFLSIYDLLAYFCFHQSGGMPCCLKAPVSQIQPESSDSSDSETEDSIAHPPHLPPRAFSVTPSMTPPVFIPNHSGNRRHNSSAHEEIFIDQSRQDSYVKSQLEKQIRQNEDWRLSPLHTGRRESRSQGSSPNMKKRVPPPKPPRTDLLPNGEPLDASEKEREELYKSARRVSGIVDMDITRLYSQAVNKKRAPGPAIPEAMEPRRSSHSSPPAKPRPYQSKPTSSTRTIPVPSVVKRPGSAGAVVREPRQPLPKAHSVDSILQTRSSSPKVTSLIQMFESKSPDNSPPLQKRNSPVQYKRSPPFSRGQSDGVVKKSRNLENHFTPSRPPKPQPPPVPPRPLIVFEEHIPVVPPRTPAPLLPPKPPGSKPPLVVPRLGHRRSLSDSQPAVLKEGETPRLPLLPNGEATPTTVTYDEAFPYEPVDFPGPDQMKEELNHKVVKELDNKFDRPPNTDGIKDGWTMITDEIAGESLTASTISQQEQSIEVSGTTGSKSSGSKWKPKPWGKILKFQRKPRKRIRKFILELSTDPSQEFGRRINEFIADMRSKSTEPHQKMLNEIRNFLTQMHEFLIEHHKPALINCGMESCDNFGHVVETTLQQLILHPLSHYIYLRIEEYYSQNRFLFQVQRSIHQGKLKQPEEMGIRKNLIVPGEKAIAEITEVFSRMMKTPCAISKLEYLLEAVRLTYENVRDSKQPKKAMNDLGADDFLPLFVWVLVQCGFYRAEIEAEYMWGLAHPSLFNGEGGYYLTTLTSAVNVLKELTQPPTQPPIQAPQLPAMNEMQTELKVYCEDEHTGQYSSAFYLPIVPNMTAAEICEIIAEKRRIPTPEKYALFKVINGKSTLIKDCEKPQAIKLQWTLDRSSVNTVSTSSAYQPSSRFMAYKLRTAPST